ncbi:vacuolar fusion protein ccz1 family protein [Pelomyxa schiedti]|nr:vacuolar fusion protein ccz1 family protein [Pelomyxa schiedti]
MLLRASTPDSRGPTATATATSSAAAAAVPPAASTSLAEFYVFNPTLAKHEAEEDKKVLFFYPPTLHFNTIHTRLGLCQAMIGFANPFSNTPLESITMEKHTIFLYNPEPDIWFIMMMHNPKKVENVGFMAPILSKNQPAPDPKYIEDRWDPMCFQYILRTIYKIIRLFIGSLLVIQNASLDQIKTCLGNYIPGIINSFNWERLDLFTSLSGLQFLPVNKNQYLFIQNFINLTENEFPAIRYTSLFYKDHVLSSDLEQEDVHTFYKLVSTSCLTHDELEGVFPYVIKTPRGLGHFLTGPQDINNGHSPIHAPYVFIGPSCEKHVLIVFQVFDFTCIFLLDPGARGVNIEWFRKLEASATEKITSFLTVIAETHFSKTLPEEIHRYIYFSHINCAIKTSMRNKTLEISKGDMAVLQRMHADIYNPCNSFSDVYVRTIKDKWIVAKKADKREFFFIFDTKFPNLTETHEEVKKIGTNTLGYTFMD